MPNYLVYRITSPSGKSYIGQTNNLQRRLSTHSRSSGCPALHAAIQKYGWSNFNHHVIQTNLTIAEANMVEEESIALHNTISPNGYNLHKGGLNHSMKQSEETCLKKSKSLQGHEVTEETKAKIRNSHLGLKASEETKMKMRNREYTEETRLKMSSAKLGKAQPIEHIRKRAESHKKPVYIDGIIYKSATDAAIELQMNLGKLRVRLKSPNFPTYYLL